MTEGAYTTYTYTHDQTTYALICVGRNVLSIHLQREPSQLDGESTQSHPAFIVKTIHDFGIHFLTPVSVDLGEVGEHLVTHLQDVSQKEALIDCAQYYQVNRTELLTLFMSIAGNK